MVFAVALTFYAGLALAVARLLSLNSRWERTVGAGSPSPAASAPHRRIEATSAEPTMTFAPESAPIAGAPDEEPVLVEVGF